MFDITRREIIWGGRRLVLEAVGDLCRPRTVLMVSHRLASMRAADRVLVLSGGKIEEEGRLDTLTAARGILPTTQELGHG